MKLIDILARELKAWPADGCSIHQGTQGNLFTVQNGCLSIEVEKADDWMLAEVTRTQWQAAVDALKSEECAHDYANKHGCPECGETASPAWDGVGSPPADVLIEMKHKNATAGWARPDFHEEQLAWVGRDHFVTADEKFGALSDYLFRPIRTPEQIAAEERENAAIELFSTINWNDGKTGWDRMSEKRKDDYRKAIDAGYRKVAP